VFCVDTWEGSPEHRDFEFIKNRKLFAMFLDNIRKTGAYQWITPLRGASLEMAKFIADESLDIIFIDGDHAYAPCLADIEAWFPKLKKSGRFIGHDANENVTPTCGVRTAVQDFCKKHGFSFAILPPPQASYLWEIYRGSPS
jgi:hypothetical protein